MGGVWCCVFKRTRLLLLLLLRYIAKSSFRLIHTIGDDAPPTSRDSRELSCTVNDVLAEANPDLRGFHGGCPVRATEGSVLLFRTLYTYLSIYSGLKKGQYAYGIPH